MYYFGAFLGGWITYGTLRINGNWAWRLPSLMQAAPSLVQVFLVLLLPESPRWLVSRGKDEQAFKILAKYHANGDEQDEFVRHEFAELKASIANDSSGKGRWAQLFNTKSARKRTAISMACGVFSQWSGTSLTGMSIILAQLCIADSGGVYRLLPQRHSQGNRYHRPMVFQQT